MAESTAGREGSASPEQIETATGEMATIRVLVTFPQEERSYPPAQSPTLSPTQSVLEELRKQRRQLHREIEGEIRDLLGPDAEVDELVLLEGSLEILAVVSTVAMAVSNFNSLVENLEKATERIRRTVRFVLRRLPVMRGGNIEYEVHGDWTPGPAMRRLRPRFAPQPAPAPQPAAASEPVAMAPQAIVVSPYIGAIVGAYGLLLAILVMVAILLAR